MAAFLGVILIVSLTALVYSDSENVEEDEKDLESNRPEKSTWQPL